MSHDSASPSEGVALSTRRFRSTQRLIHHPSVSRVPAPGIGFPVPGRSSNSPRSAASRMIRSTNVSGGRSMTETVPESLLTRLYAVSGQSVIRGK